MATTKYDSARSYAAYPPYAHPPLKYVKPYVQTKRPQYFFPQTAMGNCSAPRRRPGPPA